MTSATRCPNIPGVDYHLFFRCDVDEARQLIRTVEERADRFLEAHPKYGYDLDSASWMPGPPDVAAHFEASGDDLDEDVLEGLRESRCVLELLDQPEWSTDAMSRSVLASILRSGRVALVQVDGTDYETPQSLLDYFERKRLELFDLG